MTYNDVITLLKTLGNDASVWTMTDGSIDVIIEDFGGFDDDWNEIIRDYDEDAVEHVFNILYNAAISITDNLYITFDMGGFKVVWGYGSYDI